MPKWYTTPALPIVDAPANALHRGRSGVVTPEIIVLHHTAGTNSLKWLSTDPNSNVSAHRLVDKMGVIYKIVEDTGLAFHVGNASMFPSRRGRASNANLIALGIEIENRGDGTDQYTWLQYESVAEQCAEWWGTYGYLPIVAHGWIDVPKDDPVGWNWEYFMDRLIKVYTLSVYGMKLV